MVPPSIPAAALAAPARAAPVEMPESDAYPFNRWQFELATFRCVLVDSLAVVDPAAAIPDGAWLQVNRNGRWIRVYLHNDKDSASLKDIRPGSVIRVTGICHLTAPSADGLSSDFLVNLRSHDDVSVVSACSSPWPSSCVWPGRSSAKVRPSAARWRTAASSTNAIA